MMKMIDNDEEIIAFRADGNCICEICGKEYKKHPFSENLSWLDEPYLNRLCDGSLVKL